MLDMYTIYCKPLDYPNNFVVRKFLIGSGDVITTDEIHIGDTLEEARAFIPYRLVKLMRDPNDNPSVVETWI